MAHRAGLGRVCRAARLWPDVIANIIADYAARTIEEKVEVLVGEHRPGACIWFSDHFTMYWTVIFENRIVIVCVSPWGCFSLLRTDLSLAIRDGRWFNSPELVCEPSDEDRAMTEAEVSDINAWLARAD